MKGIPIRQIAAREEVRDPSESFNIRDVRSLLAGKDMVQTHHRHGFYYILALDNGEGSHEIDFTSYPIRDRSVFFLRPGQVHQLTLKKESTGYLVAFGKDFYHPRDQDAIQLLRKASNRNFCAVESTRFERVLATLTNIFREFTDKQEKHQEVIKANLAILFIELVRNSQGPDTLSDSGKPYAQERVEEFMDLLSTHIFDEKKVSYYAERLNLSSYQLNALTKISLGRTASDVIDEHIVLESKRHLLATSSQVNQIAHHLGYEDVSYFIRFFKKHTGYSPETFRNNFK